MAPKPTWLAEHSIAAFIGFAERGPFHDPTLVTSWPQFSLIFGGYLDGSSLANSVYGFFDNGGTACYIVRVGQNLHDGQLAPEEFLGDSADRTGLAALEGLADVSVVCIPDLMMAYLSGLLDLETVGAVQLGLIAHCELMLDRFSILDPPPGLSAQQVLEWRLERARYDSRCAALYYPWIKVFHPLSGYYIFVPPSGHVAGLYARTDLWLGPHRTPANEPIRGVLDLERHLLDHEMDLLNPHGINVLLGTAQRGVVVWGSRTLSSDPASRHIRKERLMDFIVRNLRDGTQWAIFQPPGDATVRARIARDIEDLFTLLWRSGALWGVTPEEAFSVRCDEETNSSDFSEIIAECFIVPEPGREVGFNVVYKVD